jgi:hypothetical protein
MTMKSMKEFAARNYIFIGIMIALALVQIIVPVSAEESTTAYCYRDNRSIGSVAVCENANAVRHQPLLRMKGGASRVSTISTMSIMSARQVEGFCVDPRGEGWRD